MFRIDSTPFEIRKRDFEIIKLIRTSQETDDVEFMTQKGNHEELVYEGKQTQLSN